MNLKNREAEDFLRDLHIRSTAFGGFDRNATYLALSQLSTLYERQIMNAQVEHAAEISSMKTELIKSRGETEAALKDKAALKELAARQEKQIQTLQENAGSIFAMNNDYKRMSEEFQNSLISLQKNRESILSEAREERATLLAAAKEKAIELVQQGKMQALGQKTAILEDLAGLQREKEGVLEELQWIQKQITDLLANAAGERTDDGVAPLRFEEKARAVEPEGKAPGEEAGEEALEPPAEACVS